MKKLLFFLVVIFTSCAPDNNPSDYDVVDEIWVENNGNRMLRCFTHVNAFVDKKDWYYETMYHGEKIYIKIENINIQQLFFIKTHFNKDDVKRFEKRKQMEEEDRRDSIRLESVLKTALQRAYDITDDQFEEEFAVRCDTSLYFNVNVNINYNHHFTKSQKHLMIRRESPNAIYIDIYFKNNNAYQKVLSHEQWNMTFVNDTIRDINGDGLSDFVVNWYGSCGCCLKGFSNVYLMRLDKKSFSKNFEFINPTFSPKEKVIRGICYGHPGETEMYKYKWDEEGGIR
ncbi:MAG: hypothetical protein IPL10_07155 [Bacteroidetes bacterium]|nr:hypothetical protein [Bacteroidota bacterium]